MPTDAVLSSRAESRREAYRRSLHRACLFSLSLHLVAALCVNPRPLLLLLGPNVKIGFPGLPRKGELAPIDDPKSRRISLVRAPRYQGPANLINVSVVGTEPNPDVVDDRTVKSSVGQYEPKGAVAKGRPGQPQPGDPGSPVVIELGEDWLYSPGASRVAHSDKIQILKLVRPEYPIEAVREGIEGLIKLEVRVDSLGKVQSVRTMESPAPNALLEAASVRAMRLWEFKPYRVGAHRSNFIVIVPFRYRLVD
jgi:TonB family protein